MLEAGKPTTPSVPPSNDPVRFGKLSRIWLNSVGCTRKSPSWFICRNLPWSRSTNKPRMLLGTSNMPTPRSTVLSAARVKHGSGSGMLCWLSVSFHPPLSVRYLSMLTILSSHYRYCRGCCRRCDPSKQERQISMISPWSWSWSCSYSILFSLIQFYIPLYAVYGCYNTCPSFAAFPCLIWF